MIIKFLHHGLQVADIDEAIVFYESHGFKLTKRFKREDLFAEAAHMEHEGGVIELWEFRAPHPDQVFIAKHAAIESDNLEEDLENFKANGFTEVIPITQGKILRYAFVQDRLGNCIEIGQR